MSTIGSIETSSRPPFFLLLPFSHAVKQTPSRRALTSLGISCNVCICHRHCQQTIQSVNKSRAIVSSSILSANISNKYVTVTYLLYLSANNVFLIFLFGAYAERLERKKRREKRSRLTYYVMLEERCIGLGPGMLLNWGGEEGFFYD